MDIRTEAVKYNGVFINNSDKSKAEVPFRAALLLPEEKQFTDNNGDRVEWLNLGYFKSAKVAARAFNMYAVLYYGEEAVINKIKCNAAENKEWLNFISLKANRQQANKTAAAKARALIAEGVAFKEYKPVKKVETVQGLF